MNDKSIDTPDLRPRLPADGGPAFPLEHTMAHRIAVDATKHIDKDKWPSTNEDAYTEVFNRLGTGASLRDLFALGAMTGDWASQIGLVGTFANTTSDGILEARADLFYRMADAMLAARVKP